MDVRCPQCNTLYEIDARQLRGGAATLKCSQCEHVFRLQTHASLIQENQRRWMVRTAGSGDILYFTSFDELHQWILQGKVGKDDQISRTGKKWKGLADIGEFMPIFQAVESISSISASRAAEERSQGSSPQPSGAAGSGPQREPSGASSAPSSAPSRKPEPSGNQNSGPQPRASKIRTSQQFALRETGPRSSPATDKSVPAAERPKRSPRQTGPNQAAPGSNSGTPGGRARSNPNPAQPGRAQSGQSQPGQSQPGQSQPSQAQQAPPPADANSGGSRPKVRLQTGAFGTSDKQPDADDEWSFGDAPLGEVENSGHYQAVARDDGSSSRWPVVLLVVLLVVGGGGAAVYFTRPDLVDKVLGRSGEQNVVDLAAEKQASAEQDSPPEQPADTPDKMVAAAIGEAVGAARQANADKLHALIETASPQVGEAAGVAAKAAQKAAEEPDPEELLAKANHYLEDGRPRRARAKYHKVLDADRDNVEAITGLGWSLLAMGSPSAASAQFRKALSYNSSYGDAYIGLGKAERNMGNHAAALKAYQDYLNRFPSGPKSSIARYQADKLKQELGQ